MAAPVIVSVSPPDASEGVLLQEAVEILFDQEIDEDSIVIEGNVVLAETLLRVVRTGPVPIGYEDPLDPDYLYSRGFKGIIEATADFDRIENDSLDEYDGTDDLTCAGNLWRTKLTFTPKQSMNASTSFSALLGTGLTARTVSDVTSVVTGTGIVGTKGPYVGLIEDKFYVVVTSNGNRKTGKFKWYTDSDTTLSDEVDMTRYPILLENGLYILFESGIYNTGDAFSFVVKPPEYLADIYAWSFQTGISNAEAPPVPSAPVIDSVLEGAMASVSASTTFSITNVTPEHGASNQPATTNQVVFTFSDDIDPTTITADSIYCEGVLVNQYYDEANTIPNHADIEAAGEIDITWTVNGSLLYVYIGGSGGQTLPYNNEIRIWFTSDIKSTDGSSLGSYLYWFTSRYTPIYCDISSVYGKIGNLIGEDFPEDIIYRMLLRYSLLSDMMNWYAPTNMSFQWRLIRNEWILCHVVVDLLNNLPGALTGGGSKRLADLSIRTGSNTAYESLLQDAKNCIIELTKELQSAGAPKIAIAVKGAWDPERPNFGRTISRYMNPASPLVNTSLIATTTATNYTTIREIRKLLGNYRTRING